MKQKILGIFFVLIIVFGTFSNPSRVDAKSCLNVGDGIDFVGSPPPTEFDDPNASMSFTMSGVSPGSPYTVYVGAWATSGQLALMEPIATAVSGADRRIDFDLPPGSLFPGSIAPQKNALVLAGPGIGDNGCIFHKIDLIAGLLCTSENVEVSQTRPSGEDEEQTCYYVKDMAGSCLSTQYPINIRAVGLRRGGSLYTGDVQLDPDWGSQIELFATGGTTPMHTEPAGISAQSHTIQVELPGLNFPACSASIIVSLDCAELCLTEDQIATATNLGPDKFSLCKQITDPTAQEKCRLCAGGEDGTEGIWTAVGCIKRQPEEILGRFIRLGIGIGGGVALLMILSAGFQLTISQGNAQKTAQAKEMVTAAITGLLFIIFSVTILQFIGFSILKIPGFGG
ncbi:hypothetical protein KC721_00535 [Candidatus Woesebacteria bacterium]|nr:hypothetical protein [Candidatus Woesebacteria bacterium]